MTAGPLPSTVFSCEMTVMIEPVERSRPESAATFEEPPTLYVYGDVLDEIRFNGQWRSDGLAGGLLLGRHYRDPEGGDYAVAEGFVAGTHSDDLTGFTRALRSSWKAAVAERSTLVPESEIVGWFVAPGDAAVEPDRAALLLHNTFFNHPWQVGLWVSPGSRAIAVRPAGDSLETGLVAVVDRAGARPAPSR